MGNQAPDRVGKLRAQWRNWSRTPGGTCTVLLNYAKDRSRRGNMPFDLTREWLMPKLEAGVCELSGLILTRDAPGDYRTHPYAPSIDRIEPHRGYLQANCRLVAFAVNRARSDFGDEVLLAVARGLVNNAR